MFFYNYENIYAFTLYMFVTQAETRGISLYLASGESLSIQPTFYAGGWMQSTLSFNPNSILYIYPCKYSLEPPTFYSEREMQPTLFQIQMLSLNISL